MWGCMLANLRWLRIKDTLRYTEENTSKEGAKSKTLLPIIDRPTPPPSTMSEVVSLDTQGFVWFTEITSRFYHPLTLACGQEVC